MLQRLHRTAEGTLNPLRLESGQNRLCKCQGICGALLSLLSSKTYTGTPDDDPYDVVCPEITGAANQTIEVWMVTSGSVAYKMPYSNSYMSHFYSIKDQTISLMSRYDVDYSFMPTALDDTGLGQCSYKIVIRTFSSSQAAQAYRAQGRLDTNPYDSIIYGRETAGR